MAWQFNVCTAITRVIQQHTAETAMLIQAKDKDMEDAVQGVSVSLADGHQAARTESHGSRRRISYKAATCRCTRSSTAESFKLTAAHHPVAL